MNKKDENVTCKFNDFECLEYWNTWNICLSFLVGLNEGKLCGKNAFQYSSTISEQPLGP